jgi:hypothetical protein
MNTESLKTEKGRRTMIGLVDRLNNSMSGLNVLYDEETGQLSMTTREIRQLVDAREAQARVELARERQTEIAREQFAVEQQLNAAMAERERLLEVYDLETYSVQERADAMVGINTQVNSLHSQYQRLGEVMEQTTEIIEESVDSQAYALGASYEMQREVLGFLSKEYKNLETAATNAFSAMSDDVTVTAREMANNLDENQRIVSNWSDGIATLASRGINAGLLETLREAGPSSAGHVRALVNASDRELERLNESFENGGEVAVNALATTLGVDRSVAEAAADLANSASSGFHAAIQEAGFRELGEEISNAVAGGIRIQRRNAEAAAREMVDAIARASREAAEMNSPPRVFTRLGSAFAGGIGLGFEDEIKKVNDVIHDSIPTEFDITPQINSYNNAKSRIMSYSDHERQGSGYRATESPAIVVNFNNNDFTDETQMQKIMTYMDTVMRRYQISQGVRSQ